MVIVALTGKPSVLDRESHWCGEGNGRMAVWAGKGKWDNEQHG